MLSLSLAACGPGSPDVEALGEGAGSSGDSAGAASDEETDAAGASEDGAPTESCGNAMLDEGEECDDGNAADGDGCEADCRWTPGTLLWEHTGPATRPIEHSSSMDVQVDAAGDVYVTGSASSGGRNLAWTARLDRDGAPVWETTLDVFSREAGGYIVPTGSGGAVISGDYQVVAGGAGYYFWAEFGPDGEELHTLIDPDLYQWNQGGALAPDGEGGVYTTFTTREGPDGTMLTRLEHWPSFGRAASSVVLEGPSTVAAEPLALLHLGDGRVFAFGHEDHTGGRVSSWNERLWAEVVDTSGNTIAEFTRDHEDYETEGFRDVAQLSDGRVVASSWTYNLDARGSASQPTVLFVFDPAGEMLGVLPVALPEMETMLITDFAIDPQDRIVIAAFDEAVDYESRAFVIAAYDTEGETALTVPLALEGGSVGVSTVTTAPDGHIIAAGYEHAGDTHTRFVRRFAN